MSKVETKSTTYRFRDLEFTALTPLDQNQVQVQFEGKFKNRTIIWDATISTLAPIIDCNPAQTNIRKQAITIHPVDNTCYKVNIELDVERITEATVFKTMLMIHNYKKLDLGRHEFGPVRSDTST